MISIFGVIVCLSVSCIQAKINPQIKDLNNPNSDINLTSMQLIKKYGFVGKKHKVVTEEGNMINIVQIPNDGPPVLLTHGIADTSDSWLLLGPDQSLAFLLAKAGFNVWMINARGNKYSKGHVDKDVPKDVYWDFSYEDVASQDVPAVIDYILEKTKEKQLFYIGFSQGTTIFFVMGSLRPEYMNKIKHAVLLAPVASISYCKYFLIDFISRNLERISVVTKVLGIYELFPYRSSIKEYHASVCRSDLPEKVLCELEYYFSFGLRNISNINPKHLPVVASHMPAGSSTKSFVHYVQMYRSKRFQRFDYGTEQNRVLYGTESPPEYDLSLVTAPVSIFMSENDIFSTMKDLELVENKLPNIKRMVVYNATLEFTHIEFAYGSRVKGFVNEPLIEILLSLT